MALLFPTYWGAGIWAKPCDSCYLSLKVKDLKSYDMQTISAKIGLISGLGELALSSTARR
jgi:hypothetical protein